MRKTQEEKSICPSVAPLDAGQVSVVTDMLKEVPWISNSRQSSSRQLGTAGGIASPPALSREAFPERRLEIETSSASSVRAPSPGRDGQGPEGELDEVGVPGVDLGQYRGRARAGDTDLCRIRVLHGSTFILVTN